MQPHESFSVPRRQLDVEDYIDIMRRHKGWIFGPFLFTLVASVVGVYLWPDTYVSTATVKVVPQQVPENMVQSNINQQMTDRINSMAQTILSRTILTTIINTYALYPRERSRMPIEDVVEDMRKKIAIGGVSNQNQPGRTVPAFQVTFSYENRYLAQKVVQDLVSRFIDQNIRDRSTSSFVTTQFFKDQWDSAKKELDELENRLAQFRMANQGRLPDQMDANMRQIGAMQTQIQLLNSSISRASQDRLFMESQIRIYKEQLAALSKEPDNVVAVVPRNEKLVEADREIQSWENQITVLRQHYKDSHPDVQMAMSRLAGAKRKREEILKQEGAKKGEPEPRIVNPNTVREARDLEVAVRRLQAQVEAKDLEVQEYTKEMNRLNQQLKAYQARLEGVPMSEKQYVELIRDRDLAKAKYQDLDVKMTKSLMAQEMEGRKQGETLELLDPASLPQNPTEPKRPLVVSIGGGLGLLLGVVLAGAREMKDTSLKNLKDVRAYTKLSILGSVPLLENDFVVRRRRRLAWLGWTTACLAGGVIMAGSIVYYYVTKL